MQSGQIFYEWERCVCVCAFAWRICYCEYTWSCVHTEALQNNKCTLHADLRFRQTCRFVFIAFVVEVMPANKQITFDAIDSLISFASSMVEIFIDITHTWICNVHFLSNVHTHQTHYIITMEKSFAENKNRRKTEFELCTNKKTKISCSRMVNYSIWYGTSAWVTYESLIKIIINKIIVIHWC